MRRTIRSLQISAAVAALMIGTIAPAAGHNGQHPDGDGHLRGKGAWGNIELVGVAQVTTTSDLVADVAVSPDGK